MVEARFTVPDDIAVRVDVDAMRGTVEAIRATGVPVKILIGGAPVTQEFCDEIGADGFAPDAGSAVDVAMDLLKGAA